MTTLAQTGDLNMRSKQPRSTPSPGCVPRLPAAITQSVRNDNTVCPGEKSRNTSNIGARHLFKFSFPRHSEAVGKLQEMKSGLFTRGTPTSSTTIGERVDFVVALKVKHLKGGFSVPSFDVQCKGGMKGQLLAWSRQIPRIAVAPS